MILKATHRPAAAKPAAARLERPFDADPRSGAPTWLARSVDVMRVQRDVP
jgi:hypothetical protein